MVLPVKHHLSAGTPRIKPEEAGLIEWRNKNNVNQAISCIRFKICLRFQCHFWRCLRRARVTCTTGTQPSCTSPGSKRLLFPSDEAPTDGTNTSCVSQGNIRVHDADAINQCLLFSALPVPKRHVRTRLRMPRLF